MEPQHHRAFALRALVEIERQPVVAEITQRAEREIDRLAGRGDLRGQLLWQIPERAGGARREIATGDGEPALAEAGGDATIERAGTAQAIDAEELGDLGEIDVIDREDGVNRERRGIDGERRRRDLAAGDLDGKPL